MTHQYLLEVGLEEIPAAFLNDLRLQMENRMKNFLIDHQLNFESIESFATPRRLAVRVNGLADKQNDEETLYRGPSLKIAKNEAGEWTKAALGFARGHGASVEDLFIDQLKGEDYLFVNKFTPGQPVEAVLAEAISVVSDMTFPISMRWNVIKTPYIRPIHWIVSLLDDKVVPLTFVGVTANRISQGHRFLGGSISINHASTYEKQLKDQFVVANFNDRKKMIRQQINQLAQDNHWDVPIDTDLLLEVTSIVEWPTTFYGDFEADYLTIPNPVLVTAMRDHQRYFYACDPETGNLLPIFISVRNGNADHIDNVIWGNQKVLRARLEDALFFYQEDQKKSVEDFNLALKHVNEHAKLGTYAEKEKRVSGLVDQLSEILDDQLDAESVVAAQQASRIYKFDLMTAMVNEFPELQGTMGAIYAGQATDLSELTLSAIKDQYLPTASGGELPHTQAAALLASADKLDTLVGYFKAEIIPSGSNDPYALRRQAFGLIETILDQEWHINLLPLIEQLTSSETTNQLSRFIKARVNQYLMTHDVDYDIINAVLAVNHLTIKDMTETAKALQISKNNQPEGYRFIVESLTRVVNLANNEADDILDVRLAQTDSERALLNELLAWPMDLSPAESVGYFTKLSPLIAEYFEYNMINADDPAIKTMRHQMIQFIANRVTTLFDPRELVAKF